MRLAVLLLLFPAGLAAATAISVVHGAEGGNAPTVAIVGDSLSWQADPSIDTALSQSGYVTRMSVNPGHALSSPWAQRQLSADLQDRQIAIMVIETASNDSFEVARSAVSVNQYSNLLNGLARAASGRCVVVVNAKVTVTPYYYQPDDALAVNRSIVESAITNSNERIVNWNQDAQGHRSWFRTDLLHFTSSLPTAGSASVPPSLSNQSAGDRALAQAIVEGIRSCSRPRQHKG